MDYCRERGAGKETYHVLVGGMESGFRHGMSEQRMLSIVQSFKWTNAGSKGVKKRHTMSWLRGWSRGLDMVCLNNGC